MNFLKCKHNLRLENGKICLKTGRKLELKFGYWKSINYHTHKSSDDNNNTKPLD